ncbi:hypothetical protein PhCBS80983_g00266 [Powellomyces hirtus]|uniref:Prolyl 4-hydroxylase alpha subunit domain-containing protein n=1 Tax=Powellomyces hirtus TaxID=109895 RepID=A0A507EHG1_9FUNG|nr:hypothetical protein PhCBS80983_g00266 [Powellomyces hirtus]
MFSVNSLLTPIESKELIRHTESKGYVPALLNMGNGKEAYKPGIRKSSRCILDAPDIANTIYMRLQDVLFSNSTDASTQIIGLNPRLRFLRYEEGDVFQRHRDGVFVHPDGTSVSKYTLQIYLNDGYEGGRTALSVWNQDMAGNRTRKKVVVEPVVGAAVIFDHTVLHEGGLLERGVKYVMRTDIMVKR